MTFLEDEYSSVNLAFRKLESVLGVSAADLEGEFIDPGVEGFDASEFDTKWDENICLQLPRCDDEGITLTYRELESFAQEIAQAELTNNIECWTPLRYLIRVDFSGSYEEILRIESMLEKNCTLQTFHTNDCTYEFYLDSATTPFGFMVLKSGNCDRDFPAVLSEDLFIGIRWNGKPDRTLVRRLVDGFIFELASSLQVFLRRSPRPIFDVDDVVVFALPTFRALRPLLHGAGLSDALSLYSLAIATDDPEFQIIGFVKVLEHISATVVREDLASGVRAKLLSSRALDPDAEFILELESVITTHARLHRKDSDALQLTVQKCCDASELARCSPKYLELSKVTTSTKDKDRVLALSDFASSLSATRNQIVHAKLNYKKTGQECPSEQLRELASACRVAAEQSVRWYSLQHDSVRVFKNTK